MIGEDLMTIEIDDASIEISDGERDCRDLIERGDTECILVELNLIGGLRIGISRGLSPSRCIIVEPIVRNHFHLVVPVFISADSVVVDEECVIAVEIDVISSLQQEFLLSILMDLIEIEIGVARPIGRRAR